MTKLERLRAVLAGKPVDRIPFSIWYHFGTQHAPAEETARVHLQFLEAYDLDFLKVMNDYEYPMPERMESMETPADLARLTPLDILQSPMGEQLKVIELISRELKGKALFVDTVFNAWSTMRRNLVKEAMPQLMTYSSAALEKALKIVNDNLIQYALASLERGADGIFFSVPATTESVDPEQYERFMQPFDRAFLKAIQGKGEFNILHAHGNDVFFQQLLEYPVPVFSWSDLNSGPNLAEARRLTPRTLMAGIDQIRFPHMSLKDLRDQARRSLERGGKTRFILAPGCSIPTNSFSSSIKTAREAARVQI